MAWLEGVVVELAELAGPAKLAGQQVWALDPVAGVLMLLFVYQIVIIHMDSSMI